METMKAKTLGSVILCSAVLLGTSLLAQVSAPAAESTDNDVATLKAQLAEQQKQIDALKLAMEEQKRLIEKATGATPVQPGQDTFALPRSKALGDVASTTPIIPSIAPAVAPALSGGQKTTTAAGNPCEEVPEGP